MSGKRLICLWIDNEKKEPIDLRNNIGKTVHLFRYFNNIDQSIDYLINSNPTDRIIVIILQSFVAEILQLIHSFDQIDSIYIYNPSSTPLKHPIDQYKKVQGIFSNVKTITEKLQETILERKPLGITFFSSKDENRQDPSFMYSQLLKDLILNNYHYTESDQQTKSDMLNYCREISSDDENTLNILNEFEENYLGELSIYWYTRECFLYKILNKALWTSQPDVLYKFRYFLRHLHQQIVTQSLSQNTKPLIVYRGQNISHPQMNKLKENLHGYLSFNNFLSTSLDENIAITFVNGEQIGVLFEMVIQPGIKEYPFANIEHLSFQQGKFNEKEILFSMGTVFRIVQIEQEEFYYRIKLVLTEEIDQTLAQFTEQLKKDIRSSSCFLSFIKLIRELKQFECLNHFEQMFQNEKSNLTDWQIVDGIHNTFGLIYYDRGQFDQALIHFHSSLCVCLEYLPSNDRRIAVTYNNIGSVHSSQSKYEDALHFHQLALECVKNSNISSMITYTNNIASIYFQQGKYKEALNHLERVIQLKIQHLWENHPSLIDTYHSISVIHHQMNHFEQTGFLRFNFFKSN